jgi:hypothetical protein
VAEVEARAAEQAALDGNADPDQWLGHPDHAAALQAARDRADAPPRLQVDTAKAIHRLPDPGSDDELVGPLVVQGNRTVIVGDTGHGKTTLALQLVHAAVSGDPFLHYHGAGQGPALVADLEQGLRSIKRAIRNANLHDHDDVHVLRAPDGLALDDPETLTALDSLLATLQPRLLLLDPYYKAHRGDPNDERPVTDLMRTLDALRARHGFALILLAHPRKDQPGRDGPRKLTIHDASGSGALTRGAETVLGLERLAHGYARLRILKDRDSDLPVGDAWPLIYTPERGFQLDPKEERTDEEIAQQLRHGPTGWRTAKDCAKDLGIREQRARQILEQLTAAGHYETAIGPPGRHPTAHCYRPLQPNLLTPANTDPKPNQTP